MSLVSKAMLSLLMPCAPGLQHARAARGEVASQSATVIVRIHLSRSPMGIRGFLGIACCAAAMLLSTGCNIRTESVQAGAIPVDQIPVGPIPGGGSGPVSPTNPYTQEDRAAIEQGRKYFVEFDCAGCHGGHGGGGMGPSLRNPVWIYGDSDAQVFASIAQGRSNGMPAWGTKLPSDQIWQLVAYVKSLGTPNEASPPEQ